MTTHFLFYVRKSTRTQTLFRPYKNGHIRKCYKSQGISPSACSVSIRSSPDSVLLALIFIVLIIIVVQLNQPVSLDE
jgi:hypothetical protein